MPTYDIPQREMYWQVSSAFGATTESTQWVGPKGKKGRVRDIELYLTATCVGTTTVPEICVGSSSADYTYARFRLGTAAGTGYAATAPFRATQVSGGADVYEDFTGHVKLNTAVIPADTTFYISRVAGTGGSPAGTGSSRVLIDWF